jgi:hypothetical protein
MDLTDEQWAILKPLIPDPPRRADGRGRPGRANLYWANLYWANLRGAIMPNGQEYEECMKNREDEQLASSITQKLIDSCYKLLFERYVSVNNEMRTLRELCI